MVKIGDKGHQVALCQRMLLEKGYSVSVDADFGPNTLSIVKDFQKDHSLKADGIVGQKTWEPLLRLPNFCSATTERFIVHNGKRSPIRWDRVVLWDEPGGLKANSGCYYDNSRKSERKPTLFVNHWDVCISSESCAEVLNRRKVSVHFCIDGDGTIYQLLDTQHGAWPVSYTHLTLPTIYSV